MIVVVFRARRTEAGDGDEYYFQLQRMSELARKMPGYIPTSPMLPRMGNG
jgi:heme-degrading monooxygenase HmoA